MTHPGTQLRNLMNDRSLMCPGAWNGLVARAIASTGYQACYISGGATANASGYPDIGLISLTEMCRTIREVRNASGLPVIVDADTGYGEIESVKRTVVEYDRNGAAGMHIEDQEFPKRCGHLDGKRLIPTEEMVAKVSAASTNKVHPDFLLIARTDARSVDGLDAAIERGNAYRDAGADMIFPEGLHSEEEFIEFADGCPGLLLANMTEFGKTASIQFDRFSEMGYQLVIYPVTMQRVAMGAITKCLAQLQTEGSVDGFVDSMQTRTSLYEMLEYKPGEEWNFPK
ncbi:MAG: isocitrate lyase/phosphoenolpyruvate mutase family protein [Planctomycetota bacterium]|nr:isocitrate lyase/phosphoenolpyruvate mutase family protein [Planctomycetota bacterium]